MEAINNVTINNWQKIINNSENIPILQEHNKRIRIAIKSIHDKIKSCSQEGHKNIQRKYTTQLALLRTLQFKCSNKLKHLYQNTPSTTRKSLRIKSRLPTSTASSSTHSRKKNDDKISSRVAWKDVSKE
jgi:hypothetical protein